MPKKSRMNVVPSKPSLNTTSRSFSGEFRPPFTETVPNFRLNRRERHYHFPDYNSESAYEVKAPIDAGERVEEEFDYITANCQLVISPSNDDVENNHSNPDERIPWTRVLCVRCYQVEKPLCPICLESPVSPQITPCGHIYCYPCVWRYINFENDTGCQKCAVCTGELVLEELKRVRIFPSNVVKVGEKIKLRLTRRHKASMFPMPMGLESTQDQDLSYRFLSRFVTASDGYLETLIKEDIVSMETYLAECESSGMLDDANICKDILRKLEAEEKAVNKVVISNTPPPPSERISPEDCYFYYQETTGHDVYLHSLNWACLTEEYGIEELPNEITGNVVEVETFIMNQHFRKRYRYLGHLPLGRTFHVVEIEFEDPIISNPTLIKLDHLIAKRKKWRQDKAEMDIELTLQKHAAESLASSLGPGSKFLGHAPLTSKPPTEDDFVPLSVAMAQISLKKRKSAPPACISSPLPSLSYANVSSTNAQDYVDEHRIAIFPKSKPKAKSPSCSWFDIIPKNRGGTKMEPCSSSFPPADPAPQSLSAIPESQQNSNSQPKCRRNRRRAKRSEKAGEHTCGDK